MSENDPYENEKKTNKLLGFYEKIIASKGISGNLIPLVLAVVSAGIMGVGLTIITMGVGFLAIIFGPIIVTLGIFAGALIVWLCLKIVGGQGDYWSTFRILGYANIVNIFGWIPMVSILATLVGVAIAVLGFKIGHKLTWPRTIGGVAIALVILISGALLFNIQIPLFK